MHSQRHARRARPALQHLETRENPAGTVIASQIGTTLNLTGNDFDNHIQLVQAGNAITVVGLDNTAITGGPTFNNITSIRATMKDGNDNVFIDANADFVLTGAITLDLGDGDNNASLVTSEKLSLGSLTVNAGDGYDNITVQGGIDKASAISGNALFSLGGGRNSSEPPYLNSGVTIRRVDVNGLGGVRFNSGEGDDFLNLEGMTIRRALNANGGDGALTVNTFGATMSSATIITGGREAGNPHRGADLQATNTVVQRTLSLRSLNGVNLDFVNGSTGTILINSGRLGFTTTEFRGTPTVNGNITIRGFRHTLSAPDGGDVTVTGDINITAVGQATLSTNDGLLKARNITLNGMLGADYFGRDDDNGGVTPGLSLTGSLNMRGRNLQYYQYSAEVALGGLSLVAGEEATFSTGTNFPSDAPTAVTTVTRLATIQGRRVNFEQIESKTDFNGGLTIQGSEEASFESLPRQLPGDFDNPPYGNGATTNVGGRGLLMKGRDLFFKQVEGTAIFSNTTLQATELAIFESYPKEWGIDSGLNDVYGLGAKTTVTDGSFTMQGRTTQYIQEEGEATYQRGISLIAKEGAYMEASAGSVETPAGAKISTPSGGILVQGGSADLFIEDGEVNVHSDVVVKGLYGASFGTQWSESIAGTEMTVGGLLNVDGGMGDVLFDPSGDFLNVARDVSIRGAGHARIWMYGTTGNNIGGNLTINSTTADHDWLIVGSNLTVDGSTSVSFGNGANHVEFGVDGGTIQLNGGLTINTGNGSDTILIASTTIAGNTVINSGAGADRLHLLGNTIFNGSLSADFGDGADLFEAGRPLIDAFDFEEMPAGTVTFNAAATVNLGIGNDTLALGVNGDAEGKVVLGAGGSLSIEGGAGIDAFDAAAGQFDPAVITHGFELP